MKHQVNFLFADEVWFWLNLRLVYLLDDNGFCDEQNCIALPEQLFPPMTLKEDL
jgi:hypothetical protein